MVRSWFVVSFVVSALSVTESASADPESGSPPATTEGTKITPQFETSVASTYVFRGVPQYASRTVPSSQSTAAVTFESLGPGDLALTAWNATAIAAHHAQPTTSVEVDLTAQYGKKLVGDLTGAVGYIAYLYPRASVPDGAHEVYEQLSYAGVVVPSLTVYEELVRLHGVYAQAALAKTWSIGRWEIAPQLAAAVAGYRDVPVNVNDVTANGPIKWNVSKVAYLALRGSESYLPRPTSLMPDGNRAVAARFVHSGALAVGFTP